MSHDPRDQRDQVEGRPLVRIDPAKELARPRKWQGIDQALTEAYRRAHLLQMQRDEALAEVARLRALERDVMAALEEIERWAVGPMPTGYDKWSRAALQAFTFGRALGHVKHALFVNQAPAPLANGEDGE